MPCVSALSTARNTDAAIAEVLERAGSAWDGGGPAALGVIFASPHHGDALGRIADAVRDHGLGRVTIGCTGESIIGDGREVEGATALAIWAIDRPGMHVEPIRVDSGEARAAIERGASPDGRTLIVLGDPFSFPAEEWLGSLQEQAPGLRASGGMSSGGQAPGQARLVLDGRESSDGAVAVLVGGDSAVRTVVSQGCRPIGRPLIVTKADRNVIAELGRRPALEVFRELFETLDEDDQGRVRAGLHVGRVIDEYRESFGPGDFLIRNVMGVDESGGIAITELAKVGRTVQFHVRDAETAGEDLNLMLRAERAARRDSKPIGALLFSCNGRGSRLFNTPDHDSATIRATQGEIPVAGFFAMGEIGPVGGKNFVHGFTASVAIFEEAQSAVVDEI